MFRRLLFSFICCLFVSPALAALALDGSASGATNTAVTTVSATLTTTNATDVLVACVATSSLTTVVHTVTGVAGGSSLGTGWTKRSANSGVTTSNNGYDLEVWYTTTTGTQASQNITATASLASDTLTMVVFGVSGANLTTPFDVNASLPTNGQAQNLTATGSQVITAASISTTNTNAMLFACMTSDSNVFSSMPGPAATFTNIQDINNSGTANFSPMDSEYNVVSATQSSIAVGWQTGTGFDSMVRWFMSADAIQQASAGGSIPHNSLMMGIDYDPVRDGFPVEDANLRFHAFSGASGVAPVLGSATIYGSTPAVTSAPMHQVGSASVASVPNTGGTPTSCNITAGDSPGNFQCVVVGGQVEIEYTSTGATNLTGSSDLVTETLTVTATNAGGTSAGATVVVNAYADGALTASGNGTNLNNSTLLSGYSHRPPWLVPTVDYVIGAPSSGLTACASISQAGVTVSGNTVTVTGANVTLDHIDFTTSTCSIVDNTNNGTLVISNSKVGTTVSTNSAYAIHVQTTNFTLTLINDTLFPCSNGQIGSGQTSLAGCVGFQASGTVTFEYNDFEQADSHALEQVSGTVTVNYKWNLFENFCKANGCHDNWLQWGTIGTGSATYVGFNLGYTNQLFTGVGAGEGFQFIANNGGNLSSCTISSNTAVATLFGGNPVQSNIIHGDPAVNCIDKSNYFDASGTSGLPLPGGAYYVGSMASSTTSGDIDMNTGATITP